MGNEPIPKDVRAVELYEEEDEVLILRLQVPEPRR